MRPAEAVAQLGKPLEDLYGRHVGLVVGFTLRTDGDVDSLGVDFGSGRFREVTSARLIVYDRTLVVVPEWKAEMMRIADETGVLRKRLLALREMGKDETGPAAMLRYDQLQTQYRSRLAKLQESRERLLQDISARMEEIDQQAHALERFMISVNVQFRSGEMGEASFAEATQRCGSMRAKDSRELEELSDARKRLMQWVDEPQERERKREAPRQARRPERRDEVVASDSVRGFLSLEMGDSGPAP